MSKSMDELRGRTIMRRVAAGTVLGALVLAGLSLYGDVSALGRHLGRFGWSSFVLALLLSSSNYLLRFFRWQAYLRVLGIRGVPWFESFLVFVSAFVMSVTPGKLGEVYKSYLLWERHGVPLERSAPIVIAERLTDLLALVLLSALGSLALGLGPWIALLGAGFVAFAVLVIATPRVGEWFLSLLSRIRRTERIVPKLRAAYGSLREICSARSMITATALATCSWGLECIALLWIVSGFEGASASLPAATLAYSASTIGGALAMVPGGLGVTEVGMTASLIGLGNGIDESIATGATLLIRLATLWWAVLVGAVAVMVLGRLPAASRPSTAREPSAQDQVDVNSV